MRASLASFLLTLVARTIAPHGLEQSVRLPFEPALLAALLELTPEALDAEFERLIDAGMIARRGDFVTILDRAALWRDRDLRVR